MTDQTPITRAMRWWSSRRNHGVYIASRASIPERSAKWRQLRSLGYPVVSTWIDEAGDGETGDFSELWARIEREISGARGLMLYAEPDDLPLKGALVEVGMALALGKPVSVVAPLVRLQPHTMRPMGSWLAHPQARLHSTIHEAFEWLGIKRTA